MGVVTFSKNWMYWTSSFVAIVLITFNKRLLWRAFWTFVAVATIAAFVIQSIFLIKEYLQFQKTTNMQINVLSPATFPAVTVCSLNPYQYSKINNSKSLADLMIAYNYIVEAREARLRNQSTTKPPQNLTDDQATFQRELIRHKRQSGISGTFANQYNNTLFTIVNSQAASTSAIVYCNANTTSLNFNYNSSTTAYMINVIDAVWYYCLGGMVCAIPSTICQDYTDSYELLQDINNCAMGLTNTIPGFQYPPNNTEANPAAGMAIGVAKYLCTTYANPKCDYGDYAKPENKYNGTYVYKHCTIKSNSTDTIKMSITQCDGSELTTSVAYPSNCTTFMNQFVKDLTDTMAQYDCGKSCKYPNPINQSTTVCGNSYYYDLLSEWAECNLTSSTEFTSTTALTTTELSTIELTTTESTTTELTTTVKPTTTTKLLTTTVMETTTIEPTTLLTTTEQESTSTTATSTLEFSSSSSTTKIPTSTIESSTTSSSTTTIISTSLSTLLTTSTASMTTTESTSSTSPSTTSSSTTTPQTTTDSTTDSSTVPTTTVQQTSSTVGSSTSLTTLETSTSSSTTVQTTSDSSTQPTTTLKQPSSNADSTTTLQTTQSSSTTSTQQATTSTESTSTRTLQSTSSSSSTLQTSTDSSIVFMTTMQQSSSTAESSSSSISSSISSTASSTMLTSSEMPSSDIATSTFIQTSPSSSSQSSTNQPTTTKLTLVLSSTTDSLTSLSSSISSQSSSMSSQSSYPSSSTLPTSLKNNLTSSVLTTVAITSTLPIATTSVSDATSNVPSSSSANVQTTSSQQKDVSPGASSQNTSITLSTLQSSLSGFSSTIRNSETSAQQISSSQSSSGTFSTPQSSVASVTSGITTYYPNSSISYTTAPVSSVSTSSLFSTNSVSTQLTVTSGITTIGSSMITSDFQTSTLQPNISSSLSSSIGSTTDFYVSSTSSSNSKPTINSILVSTSVQPNSSTTPQDIADAYDLQDTDSQPTTIAKVRAALEIVGAGLTTDQRDQMCYSLPQLVTSCLINEIPCDMNSDFNQVFDVDFGYCYTFNYQTPNGTHVTSRTGAIDGLTMIMFTNVSDYLPSTEYVGFKVVIHDQDYNPFPNTEGYMSSVGKASRLAASENVYTRLGSPYGNCDTLDSLKDRGQPFYFNGTYSTEGCFRSCFQDEIVEACSCADARFPYSGTKFFCNPLNQTEYACYLDYIDKNGDYYNVKNCTCYYPCEDIIYSADVSTGNWPSGTFFNEVYCPLAVSLGKTCVQFYRENAAQVTIYYKSLVFTSLVESPTTTLLDVFNNMAGNTGLWIGFTSITIGEVILVLIQTLLWLMCCKRELPEVPSCRRRNYPESDEEEEQSTETSNDAKAGNFVSNLSNSGPKTMPNSFSNNGLGNTRRAVIPKFAIQYERVSRMNDDYVPPTIASSGDASSRTLVL